MRKILVLCLVCLMVLSFAACGDASNGSSDTDNSAASGNEEDAGTAVEPVNLKFNLVKSTNDPQYEWYGRFFSDVEEASNGEIVTEVYTLESLGSTADVLEQASQGEAVVVDCDVAYLANYVPDFAAIMSPYLIQAPEEGLVLWNSDVFKGMCAELEDAGLHLIALNYEGTRNLVTNTPITSREDISKLKIRCASTTMWNAVVETLGGNPTNISMSEVYQALSQGVADGAEGVYSVIYSNKWYETLKDITLTEHLIGFTAIAMSSEIYNSLSDDAREALDSVSYDYMEEFLELSGGVQEEYKQKLIDEGVTISEIDKTEFIEAAQDVPSLFPDWTDGVYEEIQAVLESAR